MARCCSTRLELRVGLDAGIARILGGGESTSRLAGSSSDMPRTPYAHGSWPRIRLAVLKRDGWICQIQGKRCTRRATHCDHIVPWLAGGSWLDMSNLRAACRTCNLGRAGESGSRRWQSAITYITAVIGQPLLTSQYVKTNAMPSDLVIDAVQIERMTGDARQANTIRQRMINDLRHGTARNPRAWITASPDEAGSLPHHRVLTVGGQSMGGPSGARTTPPNEDGVESGALVASRVW